MRLDQSSRRMRCASKTLRRLTWALLILPVLAGLARADELPPDPVNPKGHVGDVLALGFTPDGKTLVTTGSDGLAKIWDVATRTVRADLTGHEGKVLCVAISSDGKTIATGGEDRTVRLWSTADGTQLGTLSGHSGAVTALAFAPDGKTLASGSLDTTIRLWDVAAQASLADARGARRGRRKVWPSPPTARPSPRRAATARSGSGTSSSSGPSTLLGKHNEPAWCVAFAPDGKTVVSGGLDKMVRFWPIDEPEPKPPPQGPQQQQGPASPQPQQSAPALSVGNDVLAIAFAPDGKTLAAAVSDAQATVPTPGSVVIVDARESGTDRGPPQGPPGYGPGPGVRARREDARLERRRSLDPALGRRVQDDASRLAGPPRPPGPVQDRIMMHLDPVVALAFAPDGKTVATATGSPIVTFWDVATHEIVRRLRDPSGAVRALAISPDGATLAFGGDGQVVTLWDLAAGRERAVAERARRRDHLPGVRARWQDPRLGEPRCLGDHLGRRQGGRANDPGPAHQRGHLRGVRARWPDARHRLARLDGEGLGPGLGRAPPLPRRASRRDRRGGVRARRQDARLDEPRRHDAALGPRQGVRAGHAPVPLGLGRSAGVPARRPVAVHRRRRRLAPPLGSGRRPRAGPPHRGAPDARCGDGHCRRRSDAGQRRGRSPAQALGRGRPARAPAVRGRRGEGPIPGALARWQGARVGHDRRRRSALGPEAWAGAGRSHRARGPGGPACPLARRQDPGHAPRRLGLELRSGSGTPPPGASWTIWRASRSTPGSSPSPPTAGRWRRPAGRRPCLDWTRSDRSGPSNRRAGVVRSIAVSPDGSTIATAGADGVVTVWDVAVGVPFATLKGHTRAVLSVAFSPDGKTLASSGADRTVRLWDVAAWTERATLRGPIVPITALAFAPDGKRLASSCDGDPTVSFWDVAQGRLAATLTLPGASAGEGVSCLAFDPDGKTLYTGGERGIEVWDVTPASRALVLAAASSPGQERATLRGHADIVRSLAVFDNGKALATRASDGTIKVWDVRLGRVRLTLGGEESRVLCMGISAGRPLAGRRRPRQPVARHPARAGRSRPTSRARGQGRRPRSARSLEAPRRVPLPSPLHRPNPRPRRPSATAPAEAPGPAAGPAPQPARTGASPLRARPPAKPAAPPTVEAKVWSLDDGHERATLSGHNGAVVALEFSRDGKTLATTSRAGVVKLWDTRTFQVDGRPRGATGGRGPRPVLGRWQDPGRGQRGGPGDALGRGDRQGAGQLPASRRHEHGGPLPRWQDSCHRWQQGREPGRDEVRPGRGPDLGDRHRTTAGGLARARRSGHAPGICTRRQDPGRGDRGRDRHALGRRRPVAPRDVDVALRAGPLPRLLSRRQDPRRGRSGRSAPPLGHALRKTASHLPRSPRRD